MAGPNVLSIRLSVNFNPKISTKSFWFFLFLKIRRDRLTFCTYIYSWRDRTSRTHRKVESRHRSNLCYVRSNRIDAKILNDICKFGIIAVGKMQLFPKQKFLKQ